MSDARCKWCRKLFEPFDLIRFLTIEADPAPYRYAEVKRHDEDEQAEWSGWGHEACVQKVLALRPLDEDEQPS